MITQLESALRALSAGAVRPAAHYVKQALEIAQAQDTSTNDELKRLRARHVLTLRDQAELCELPTSVTPSGRWTCGTLASWLLNPKAKAFRRMPAHKLALLRGKLGE